jgi:hypothetical protein
MEKKVTVTRIQTISEVAESEAALLTNSII